MCNVFWQVNGAVELGEGSSFSGTIIANGAITLLEGASLRGKALTRQGAISLHNNAVRLDPPPNPPHISANGAITFCAGGSVVLSGNVGGIWSTGETTASITVSASGDYSATIIDACGDITSNHIIVVVNPLPTATISANGPTTFCAGGSVLLTASAASSYSWSTGETTQSITVTTSGSYTVEAVFVIKRSWLIPIQFV